LCLLTTTTTINPTIIPVWPCIVFTERRQRQTQPCPHILITDGRHQRKIQPYYDHIECKLTDDNNQPTIIRPHIVFTDGQQQQTDHNTTTYCLLIDDNSDKPNHNTTTYCVYWRTTTTTNPIIIRQYIAVT
jgi:hypothetical protein